MIIVNLKSEFNGIGSFEEQDKNIAKLSIQLPTGEIISGQGYRVNLDLSKDARLGLGIELIRSVMRNENNNYVEFEHLYPIEKNHTTQYVGIYLHPESCELLISSENFEPLKELQQKIIYFLEKKNSKFFIVRPALIPLKLTLNKLF